MRLGFFCRDQPAKAGFFRQRMLADLVVDFSCGRSISTAKAGRVPAPPPRDKPWAYSSAFRRAWLVTKPGSAPARGGEKLAGEMLDFFFFFFFLRMQMKRFQRARRVGAMHP